MFCREAASRIWAAYSLQFGGVTQILAFRLAASAKCRLRGYLFIKAVTVSQLFARAQAVSSGLKAGLVASINCFALVQFEYSTELRLNAWAAATLLVVFAVCADAVKPLHAPGGRPACAFVWFEYKATKPQNNKNIAQLSFCAKLPIVNRMTYTLRFHH
jgi:hypothetical protein